MSEQSVGRTGTRSGRKVLKSPAATRCRRKFHRFFPGGFRDETYIDWERGYKWPPTISGAKALTSFLSSKSESLLPMRSVGMSLTRSFKAGKAKPLRYSRRVSDD